jgi:phage major head subunit gpT-like protein
MATFTSQEISDLLYPGLHAVFMAELKEKPMPWMSFMNVLSSSRYDETDFEATQLGPFAEKHRGRPIGYDTPLRVGTKTYTHKTYALGYRVERELVEDDQYSTISRYPKLLASSANHTLNILGHQPLNNGWDSAFKGTDGKVFFATDHPKVKSGGTQANKWTTAQEFSRTALQSVLVAMRKWQTHEGRPAQIKPIGIVCGPDLLPEVWDAISNPKVPESNANANNWVKTQGISICETDWLVGTKYWFVHAAKSDHQANFFWRVKISYENDTHFDMEDMRYKGRFRCSSGFTKWQGWWGSNPS